MRLETLELAIRPLQKLQINFTFSEILREARTTLGIKQFKAAEFIGIKDLKLKSYESGFLRTMPPGDVLINLSKLYGLDLNVLVEQAQMQCSKNKLRKIKR